MGPRRGLRLLTAAWPICCLLFATVFLTGAATAPSTEQPAGSSLPVAEQPPGAEQPAGTTQSDTSADSRPQVLLSDVDGSITPVVADHLADVIDRAESEGYDAVAIQLDTPGGLEASMRAIIQDILGAEVPVIVYVTPEGARAASAGALITFSAHVAAMAPATAIGAATPVDLAGDEDLSDSDRKAVNDAASLATSLAERRDRNIEFAEDTVRDGRSASASEALELGAVDTVSPSLGELLGEVDGWTVEVAPGDEPVTLHTADAEVDSMDMGLLRQIQQFLADPNLAFLFLSVGTLGLIYELASPGVGGAGVAGAVLSSTAERLPTGPTIVLCLSVIVVVSLTLAPNRGVLWGWLRHRNGARRLRARIPEVEA